MKAAFQIKISLKNVSPPVWRRMLIPEDFRLSDLHLLIQIAMGWGDSHLHEFGLPKDGPIFMPGEVVDDMDDERYVDESTVAFHEVCARVKDRLKYTYDFGDFWLHDIVVEKVIKVEEGDRVPVCLDGKNACPPDDCGGANGYGHLMEVISDPEHEEYEEILEWVGEYFDPCEFDLDEVNREVASVGWGG